jgi:hypothetical protein
MVTRRDLRVEVVVARVKPPELMNAGLIVVGGKYPAPQPLPAAAAHALQCPF